MLDVETLAAAAAGAPLEVGYPEPRAEPRAQPGRAGLHRPGRRRAAAARAHLRAHPARVRARHRGHRRSSPAPTAWRVGLRDVRTGARAHACAPRYVVAADGARSAVRARARHRAASAPRTCWWASRRCSARRSGTSSASTATSSTRSTQPERPRRPSCPPAASDRWLYRAVPGAAPSARRRASRRARPARRRRARPAGADRALAPLLLGGAARGALPLRPRLPRRRRRAPGDAARRDRPQPRAARRLRPRLEARLGRCAAGRRPALLDSYEAERRPVAEHTAARSADPRGSLPRARAGGARGPRRPDPARLVGRALDARPARHRPDAVRGARLGLGRRRPPRRRTRAPVTVSLLDPARRPRGRRRGDATRCSCGPMARRSTC